METLNAHQPNACAYLRLLLPLTKPIVKEEFDITFGDIDNYQHMDADIVITQRVVLKTLKRAERLVSYCARKGARLVYDLDDDLLSLAADHNEHSYYQQMRPLVTFLLRESHEVWVSTEDLARRLAPLSDKLAVLQNHLDPRVWQARQPAPCDGPVRLLFMGTTTHQSDFDTLLRPALARVRERVSRDISLTLIGVMPNHAVCEGWQAIRPPDHVSVSYPAFANWLMDQGPYDIGLAPLADNQFNQSKSRLKFLEYSGLGLATVASTVGEYREAIVDGVNGRLGGNSAEAFEEALFSLITNEDLRLELAGNASRLVAESLAEAHCVEPRLERLRGLEVLAPPLAAQ